MAGLDPASGRGACGTTRALLRCAMSIFIRSRMAGDFYRSRAAELRAKAQRETSRDVRLELEGLAAAYLRLAGQAERNELLDVSYETPPPKEDGPDR